jgi:O-antigen/teichoic acid export membrane protein
MQKSRTKNSIINIKFAFVGQIFGIVISLFSRLAFVKILSSEYLGLSSLFSNILTLFSLTELGFGTALSYKLYKPLEEKNIEEIKTLMNFFKKVYAIIGIVIIFLGLITLPIYSYFISEVPDIPNLNLIYLLFVFNTSCSYFVAYKRLLIISDQKKYIDIAYKYTFYFLLNISQIIILIITHNYILYLVVQVLFTLLENIAVSLKCNKLFPYLCDKTYKKITRNEISSIIDYIKVIFFHKFGGVVLNSTDNIVLSKVLGLASVGLYSNYYLIINALNTIIGQVFNSMVASIGSLNVHAKRNKKTDIFNKLFFANFVIYLFCCTCFLSLINPFIKLWLGSEYILNLFTIVILTYNFYLFGMRRTAMAFREATGNYKRDWYSPIVEAVINIISSLIFVKKFGIAGVFMGTILSSLCTNFWLEPYVIIKKSLNSNLSQYLFQHLKYTIVVLISCVLAFFINSLFVKTTIFSLLIKGFVSLGISAAVLLLFYKNNKYFKFYLSFVNNLFHHKKIKND